MPSDEESLRANARARLLRLHAQHRIIHVSVAGAEMKRITLIALLMLPTLAQANDLKTLQCHAAIVHSAGERITGVSERMTGALVVDSVWSFTRCSALRFTSLPAAIAEEDEIWCWLGWPDLY
ncbi:MULTISPECIES: hypothetical protein [Enterobacteriaceae]|uniref:Uncharacterized protein n=2 Tax=Enterobacteriaceae TaxID=543 RepID=A0AB35XDK3_9ENTR|nr:hypothetical protein [Shigella sonnei]